MSKRYVAVPGVVGGLGSLVARAIEADKERMLSLDEKVGKSLDFLEELKDTNEVKGTDYKVTIDALKDYTDNELHQELQSRKRGKEPRIPFTTILINKALKARKSRLR